MPLGVTGSSKRIGDVIHIFKNTLALVSNSNSKSSLETMLLLITNWTKVLELAKLELTQLRSLATLLLSEQIEPQQAFQ